MFVAVFCRSDHPAGYGRPVASTVQGGRWVDSFGAHGYVTLIVLAESEAEIQEVREIVGGYLKGYHWTGRNDDWYSGQFDLVWWAECSADDPDAMWNFPYGNQRGYGTDDEKQFSLGDNRAVCVIKAAPWLERNK